MRKNLKNIFFIILTFIIFVSSITIYAYSSLINYKPKYGTLNANVNFRNTASTSSGKIRVLPKGTAVKMVADIDKFYIVQLGTNEVGVVSKQYVNSATSAPKGASTYTAVTIKQMKTKDKVNLRSGPSTSFSKVITLSKSTNVKVVGYVSDWYVVVTEDNKVGCIRKDLLSTSSASGTATNTQTSFSMSENEKTIFDLINKARKDNGLNVLQADSNLFKVARIKADDMVKNSYFSHTSPTYGSPFEMMKSYKISYKVAGENIAGNPSLTDAVTAWLNSNTHRQNILSNSYNYLGIGVEKSDTYGFVITAMFIRKIGACTLLFYYIFIK